MTQEELEITQAACCVGTMWDQYEGTEKFNEMVGKRVRHLIELVRNHLEQEQPEVSARHGWVARDMNNDLHYFSIKPIRSGAKWWDRDNLSMEIDGSLFGELTWEDEPIEVELFIRELGLNANQIRS